MLDGAKFTNRTKQRCVSYHQPWELAAGFFINAAANEAFERCLFEACDECGWMLEGHCVMTNHFHLVIRTPQGNRPYGMKWLQMTFANRYHRFRKVHGKLFARQAAQWAPV